MANYILFVFEGEKTERLIFDKLKRYFFNDPTKDILISYHCGEIYSLYHKLKNDPGLDLYGVLQETPGHQGQLHGISRTDISETYLFFDYDGHAPAATDTKLLEQLSFFDNETDEGKLYISYPMVEALQHLQTGTPFQGIRVKAKENIHYKDIAKANCDACFANLGRLALVSWKIIISEHCKKLNHLMTGSFTLPVEISEQLDVFEQQLDKHITPNGEVAVLSAFPVFILDYYGASKLPDLI
ncbi:MAG: hypothetical protein ACI8PB_004412 [Desulforhopalus sp.]